LQHHRVPQYYHVMKYVKAAVSKSVRTTVSNYQNHTVTSYLRTTGHELQELCHKLQEVQCHKLRELQGHKLEELHSHKWRTILPLSELQFNVLSENCIVTDDVRSVSEIALGICHKQDHFHDICVSHSDVTEDSSLLGCDAVSLNDF
jgi:hypothetical protein